MARRGVRRGTFAGGSHRQLRLRADEGGRLQRRNHHQARGSKSGYASPAECSDSAAQPVVASASAARTLHAEEEPPEDEELAPAESTREFFLIGLRLQ